MKKIIAAGLIMTFLGFASVSNAQSTVKKAEQGVKKGAKKVGNKTAEVASKAKSKVVDQTYKDRVGPAGQTIYINGDSKYYWVDKKGHKHFVTEGELRAKEQ
jgi:hypothetical protein